MSYIPADLRQVVISSAENRCEYCGLSQNEHFRWQGVLLNGSTATGRATIKALDMNRPLILAIRKEEALLGRHEL